MQGSHNSEETQAKLVLLLQKRPKGGAGDGDEAPGGVVGGGPAGEEDGDGGALEARVAGELRHGVQDDVGVGGEGGSRSVTPGPAGSALVRPKSRTIF